MSTLVFGEFASITGKKLRSTQLLPDSYRLCAQVLSALNACTDLHVIEDLLRPNHRVATLFITHTNKVIFSRHYPALTLTEAIARMGAQRSAQMVAYTAFHDLSLALPAYRLTSEKHRWHALFTACLMQELSGYRTSVDGFAIGLFHGIGRWTIQSEMAQAGLSLHPYSGAIGACQNWEQNLLNTNHAQVGARTLEALGMPPNLTDPVGRYLQPIELVDLRLSLCSKLANHLRLAHAPQFDEHLADIAKIGLTPEEFALHYERAQGRLQAALLEN